MKIEIPINIVEDFNEINRKINEYNETLRQTEDMPDLMDISSENTWLTENLEISILSHDGNIGIWLKLSVLKSIAKGLIKNRDRPIEEYVRLLNHYGFVTTGQVRLGLRS